MKITDLKLYILEAEERPLQNRRLMQVPGLRRLQYNREGNVLESSARPQLQVLKVYTDEGITGCVANSDSVPSLSKDDLRNLRQEVLGENPLHREKLFQKLYSGARWFHCSPGWMGILDNCLWDIAGKAANLPVWALIGRARDRCPAYLTGPDDDLRGYLDYFQAGQEDGGVMAFKIHSYKGGKHDIPMLRAVRETVGPDVDLIHDPVCSYDLREAIEVAEVLEELDYAWLEEPFREPKMNLYQALRQRIRIPVVATETLMHDMDLIAQWLIQGATDWVRARASFGTTQVLKLAHLAELHNANIELNANGGLFGLVHAHLCACIPNTTYYEINSRFFGREGHRKLGAEWGLANAPLIEGGCIAPPDGPGWGAIWDDDTFDSLVKAIW